MHGAKVARTVIRNWSHVQQRAVRVMSYSITRSVENAGGTEWELGLAVSGKLGGQDIGSIDLGFSRAVSSGNLKYGLRNITYVTYSSHCQTALLYKPKKRAQFETI